MLAIHRKLVRDLWTLRGQAVAVAAVIACGVAISVMSLSTLESLSETRDTYYGRFAFAHLFASVKRAPLHVATRLNEIDGVAQVEARIVRDVTMMVEGLAEPAVARLISIPDTGTSRLNQVYLRRGRMPQIGHGLEVLVGESFAAEHSFRPGDSVQAILNGRLRTLRIVGVALSPEYVLQIKAGDMLPDTKRFGIFWMPVTTMEAAFDMKEAFNDVSVSLMYGASEDEAKRRMDLLLDPWGNGGAYGRDEQVSARYLDEEITQLRGTGMIVPIVFLAVAAFLLNIVLSRLISTQREQIAAMKAFGYSNVEVGLHYFQMIAVIVFCGVVLGTAVGAWMGHGLTSIYTQFYRFPMFHFAMDLRSTVLASSLSLVAASIGSLSAVAAAVQLPPAEAMRPEPPPRYQPTLVERFGLQRWFSQTWRMILRQLQRRPWKSSLSCLGIGLGTAVMVVGSFGSDALDYLIEFQFRMAQRDDVMVTFYEPTPKTVLNELHNLPCVIQVEAFRSLPVRLTFGPRDRRLALMGLSAQRELFRLFDADVREIQLPESGLLISEKLAQLLNVSVGDRVAVDVLEGKRPQTSLIVSGLIRDFSGTNAYVHSKVIDRIMAERPMVSGAWLTVDASGQQQLYETLKQTPRVAGVTVKMATIQSFLDTIAENQLRMRLFNIAFACVIACGVVYNTARIALAERSRELATLRVLGFTTGEVSGILLGELAVLTVIAIPLGLMIGHILAWLTCQALQTEMYRIPFIISRFTYLFASVVVLLATIVSSLLVRRRIDQLDMVEVLKSRE
ncbi:MAG: ABC transporter permease [Planctomycetaceae bacterium]